MGKINGRAYSGSGIMMDQPKRGRGQPKKLDPKIHRKMRLAPDVDAIIRAQAENGTGAMTRFVEDAIREKFNRESER